MAHLTCELHNRRALVINSGPGLNPSRILHRNDGTRCGDMYNDFVKYRGHTLTIFTILGGRIPKFQALTKKQWRTMNERETKDMYADLAADRVAIVQTELRPPR